MSGFVEAVEKRVATLARLLEYESRQTYDGSMVLLPVMQSRTPPTDWDFVMMQYQNESGREY